MKNSSIVFLLFGRPLPPLHSMKKGLFFCSPPLHKIIFLSFKVFNSSNLILLQLQLPFEILRYWNNFSTPSNNGVHSHTYKIMILVNIVIIWRYYLNLKLDKPARLIIRLLFGFVCQAQQKWKQILRRQCCLVLL